MLDVRPVAYISPVAEQPIGPLTPSVHIISYGDEAAGVTGLFRIYRKSTDQLLYSSEIPTTAILGHGTAVISALTPWNPPAPADDDFFVCFSMRATNSLVPDGVDTFLGSKLFDIKTVPMGPVPAGHHTTHEAGGMDEIDCTGLVGTGGGGGGTGLSETPQTLTDQAAIDWDLALGGAAKVTLGGDRTLNAPTNMVDGMHARLKVFQDGTGTRLITWNAAYRFPGGVDPTLSAAINSIDLLTFDCDGTNMDCTGMVSALA